MFKSDPKLGVLKGEGVQYHTYGWPAPAVAWAENEMKKIIAG